jgi:hypothetical protein
VAPSISGPYTDGYGMLAARECVGLCFLTPFLGYAPCRCLSHAIRPHRISSHTATLMFPFYFFLTPLSQALGERTVCVEPARRACV